jgi:hypothetical protein
VAGIAYFPFFWCSSTSATKHPLCEVYLEGGVGRFDLLTLSGIRQQTVSPIEWHHFSIFTSVQRSITEADFGLIRLGLGTVKRWSCEHAHGRLDSGLRQTSSILKFSCSSHPPPIEGAQNESLFLPYERKTDNLRNRVPPLHPLSRCVRRQTSAISGDRSGAPLDSLNCLRFRLFLIDSTVLYSNLLSGHQVAKCVLSLAGPASSEDSNKR